MEFVSAFVFVMPLSKQGITSLKDLNRSFNRLSCLNQGVQVLGLDTFRGLILKGDMLDRKYYYDFFTLWDEQVGLFLIYSL